ncbi:unnamed protein product [Ambrosiozyma monospora]|uniref:Unnamed protein product n=1 Tax=Ambrosiozyma monospora TaxID=43982 RepID=A0ACB5TR02_AMBMO|nr:unnamed protein product [Ambrosiozyma monospora]
MSDSYIPMQVQPCMFECLCAIAWIQSMYYPPYSYPKKRIILFTTLFFSCAIGMQVGFGVWLKRVYANGTHWPSLIFGIIASIILAAGLVPPYVELFKRQGRVVGINFVFLIMDCSGAVFSMASTLVGEIDVMGMILYAIIIVMEIGIMTSQVIWLLRFRFFRKEKDVEDDEDEDEDEAGSCEKGKGMRETDDEEKQLRGGQVSVIEDDKQDSPATEKVNETPDSEPASPGKEPKPKEISL